MELAVTPGMLARAKAAKSVGWLKMRPHDFLTLIVQHSVDAWIAEQVADKEVHTVAFYNEHADMLPYLEVDRKTGKVLGHEGRHRSAACLLEKVAAMPVAIFLREGRHTDYYDEPWIDELDSPHRFKKVFLGRKDVPKTLHGQFAATQVKIDPAQLHEFWANTETSTYKGTSTMPTPYIEKLHKEGKGSIKELEAKWNQAKKAAEKEGHGDDFAYITGVFKKMAKASASKTVARLDKSKKAWINQFVADLKAFGVRFDKTDIRIDNTFNYVRLHFIFSRDAGLYVIQLLKEKYKGDVRVFKGNFGGSWPMWGIGITSGEEGAPSLVDVNSTWGDLYIQW